MEVTGSNPIRVLVLWPYMTMRLAVLECSFSSSFSLICRLVWGWKTETLGVRFNLSRISSWKWDKRNKRRGLDLSAVQLQLVVSDPPGFAVLQSLRCVLLHLVLFQSIWLDHLLKSRDAAATQWSHRIQTTILKKHLIFYSDSLTVH